MSDNLKQFAYLNIAKYYVWQSTQTDWDLPIPPRNIHVIKDDPKSEYVTIQWGTGQKQVVPRSLIYYANRHIHAIADKLRERAGKSENFADVVESLSHRDFRYVPEQPYYVPDPNQLTWQNCPPYVLGAVRAIGYSLNVPHDVLLSDELLPTIARILRNE